jgi:acyl carrier protein phosphodiesterase
VANDFYENLLSHYDILTERTKGMMPYMIARNWLVSYASIEGLAMILFQMDHRTKNRVAMHESVNELKAFYTDFEEEFTTFFEELQVHCQEKLAAL